MVVSKVMNPSKEVLHQCQLFWYVAMNCNNNANLYPLLQGSNLAHNAVASQGEAVSVNISGHIADREEYIKVIVHQSSDTARWFPYPISLPAPKST